MTTTIMTRPAAPATEAAAGPEHWCGRCSDFHSGPCPAAAHRRLGVLLERMVRDADTRIPAERRARRTLQEMAPGYERQPILTLTSTRPGTPAARPHTSPAPQAQRPCGTCGGKGGWVVDTSGGGVTRQSWQRCQDCRGAGVQSLRPAGAPRGQAHHCAVRETGPGMGDGWCPLCERFNCDPNNCPPSSSLPVTVTAPAAGGGQCDWCGQWFPNWNGGTCQACRALGH
ncbi:hypothetical protein AB0M23_21470 [Streptomyces sp. NPDC052077]|uniref:hypothetical protein n=1 Tax=Streptomyces sp. NPDC052077 TaxID=3154757 RepID=UPI00343FCBB9